MNSVALGQPAAASRLIWAVARIGILVVAGALLAAGWLAPTIYVVPGLAALALLLATLRYPVLGFCLLGFSVPWGSGFELPVGAFPVTTTDLLIAAIGGAWLVWAAFNRRNPVQTRMWVGCIAVFLIVIALSAGQAADFKASLREIVKWLEMGVVYLAAVALLRSKRDMRLVIASLVLGGVSQAMLGYVQFATQSGPAAFVIHGTFLRAYGTFDQPNPYAGYLNLILPFALAMGVATPAGRSRTLYRVASVLLVGALIVSESRGALLAGLVAAGVVLCLVFPGLRRLLWAGVALGILGAWLAAYDLIPLGPFARALDAVGLGGVSFTHVTDANFSAVERAAHWLAGIRMFAAHPLLGVGIGNYAQAYPAFHPRGWYASLEHAHNYYINIAAEAGIFGLAAYILLMGSALWYSFATLLRTSDSLTRAAALGVVGALVATSIHNLFDVLYVHGTVALLGMMLAFLPAGLRAEVEEGRV